MLANPSRRRIVFAGFLLFVAGCAATLSRPDGASISELAPGGKLRVALFTANPVVIDQPAGAGDNELAGVGVDLGRALAQRLGVVFEPVRYANTTSLLGDARTGKWDVALLGIEAARMTDMDFTPPYAAIENTYIVRANSALMSVRDVDRKNVRIAAGDRTVQYNALKAQLKEAVLVPAPSTRAAFKELVEGRIDAFASNRTVLEDFATTAPGYRVLPGGFLEVKFGIGVPKGRPAAVAYASEFVREMIASGAIADSIARHKVRNFKAANQP